MKEADALPFVVTYSAAGETMFIKFELEEDHCGFELEEHHCSEQYSLFVDFIKEIVDAVLTDQLTQKLLKFLELSSKVRGKLQALNDKRKRWNNHDEDRKSVV